MKNPEPIFLSAIIFALFSIALISGCKKAEDTTATCTDGIKNGTETGVDCGGSCAACIAPCDTIVCLNGGTCSSGNCNCPSGWTGSRCEQNTPAVQDARQHNEDVINVKTELENLNSDVNSVLKDVIGFGKKEGIEAFTICGATVDTTHQYDATPTVFINFDGTSACGTPSRIRSGQVKVELIAGAKWTDAGAQLRITHVNYKVEFPNLNNRYLIFNGAKYLTDVSGIDWINIYLGTATVVMRERSTAMQITFENGQTSLWKSARLTTWGISNSGNVYVIANGDTTINGKVTESWGVTRFGTNFTTEVIQTWKTGTACGWWRPTQDKYTSVTDNFTVTSTFSVDADGNPVTSGCASHFKLEWHIIADNSNGNGLIPYH